VSAPLIAPKNVAKFFICLRMYIVTWLNSGSPNDTPEYPFASHKPSSDQRRHLSDLSPAFRARRAAAGRRVGGRLRRIPQTLA
jgi:hypothetical protein